jgi:tetratricopeptide (TPR) repeat protein
MDVCYNLGVAYYSFGEYEKAAEYLDKEVRARPEDAQGHGLLGSAYYLLGRNDKAREHLGKAKEILDEAGDSESVKEIDAILQTLQQSESVPED